MKDPRTAFGLSKESGARPWADDAINDEIVRALEGSHRRPRPGTEDAVGANAESLLHADDGVPAAPDTEERHVFVNNTA